MLEPETKDKTILIVDDEQEIRRLLERLFAKENYITLTAETAVDALMKAQDNDVDIVITDLRMPGMDGLELIGQIHDIKPGMPVVVISGYGTFDTVVDAVRKGAFFFVNKPFDQNTILEAVARGLRLPRHHMTHLPPVPGASNVIEASFPPDHDNMEKMNHQLSSVAGIMGYSPHQRNISIPFVAGELLAMAAKAMEANPQLTVSARFLITEDTVEMEFTTPPGVYNADRLPSSIEEFDITDPSNIGLLMAKYYAETLTFSPDGAQARVVMKKVNLFRG
ncbi:MAG: response regulator [Nitrospinae bacterium]|nr:response regulator [Nitrospinota bacterium]